jgi:hypothetical protein
MHAPNLPSVLSGLALTLTVSSCVSGPTPAGQITHVVALVETDGVERLMYVDPTMVDAVFLSEAARNAFYSGTGRRGPRALAGALTTVAKGLPPRPCAFHCGDPGCFCMCDDILGLKRIGVVLDRTELWWVNPVHAQAIFLTDAAASLFTGGTSRPQTPGDPEGLLVPEGNPVAEIGGSVSFGMP